MFVLEIIFSLVSSLFWPVLIVWLIWRSRRNKNNSKEYADPGEALGQIFILLSVAFLGVALQNINQSLGGIFELQTIVLITVLISFLATYILRVIFILPFSLLGFLAWWAIQSSEWFKAESIKSVAFGVNIVLIILIYFCLGFYHQFIKKYKTYSTVYFSIGLASITAILFSLSTNSGIRSLEKMLVGNSVFQSFPFTLIVVTLTAAVFILLFNLKQLRVIKSSEFIVLSGLVLFFLSFLFIPQIQLLNTSKYYIGQVVTGKTMTLSGVFYAIVFNAVIFFEVIALIVFGYYRKEAKLINFGVFTMSLLIIVKYFDWFFTFLDKSLFFIGAGVLLFLIGILMERGRKKILSEITTHTNDQI